jgi:hypothetical protein
VTVKKVGHFETIFSKIHKKNLMLELYSVTVLNVSKNYRRFSVYQNLRGDVDHNNSNHPVKKIHKK